MRCCAKALNSGKIAISKVLISGNFILLKVLFSGYNKAMSEKTFKRKFYDEMLEWKNTSAGSSALMIDGARRVGKSTIAETFAKK